MHVGQEPPKIKLDSNGMPTGPLPGGGVVMPASRHMAEFMAMNADELRARGVNFSLGGYSTFGRVMNAEGNIERTRGRKIYPNEPCPCGSGKKYKHCHGKNR